MHLKASEALSLQAEAENKVRKDEKYKNSIEFAKNLIILAPENDFIVRATGLTIEQIERLRAETKE